LLFTLPSDEGIQKGSLSEHASFRMKEIPLIILNINICTGGFLAFNEKLTIFFKSQHTFFLEDETAAHVLPTFDIC